MKKNINYDLAIIKKYYGENFSRLCRELFPSILEYEGMLSSILLSKFAPSRFLYDDVLKIKSNFRDYIMSIANIQQSRQPSALSAVELMDHAGYILFPECQDEGDIYAFKYLYRPDEEICTFDGGRLKTCRVWFAVKKNAEQLNRDDFIKPTRQDEYGTSVISIQFTKGKFNYISIKNRYNHSVKNPDSTFSNNLDNIIPGLTDAFERDFGLNIHIAPNVELELLNYVKADDDRLYKANYLSCLNNPIIYGCANNIIIDNQEVIKYDKGQYLVIENYVLDLSQKTIFAYKDREDEFTKSIGQIKSIKIDIDENGNKKVVLIPLDKDSQAVILTVSQDGKLLGYQNHNVEIIGDKFLENNQNLQYIDMPKLKKVGKFFLQNNRGLEKIDLPALVSVGQNFCSSNDQIKEVRLPNLKTVNSNFLFSAKKLKSVGFPMLEEIGNAFLASAQELMNINLPKAKIIGDFFLMNNQDLAKIKFRSLRKIGNSFLSRNSILNQVILPSLQDVGNDFLSANERLTTLDLPALQSAGNDFLGENIRIESLYLPSLVRVGDNFLRFSKDLAECYFPKLKTVGNDFMSRGSGIEIFNAPNLLKVGSEFLSHCQKIEHFYAPNIKEYGKYMLLFNDKYKYRYNDILSKS